MKTKMPLAEAEEKAQAIVRFIEPWCERVEIAGSIRRRRPEVGDIEIVAIPSPIKDMFGDTVPLHVDHALNLVDWSRLGKVVADGLKMKKIIFDDVQLDLFIVTPPAQFGVILAIRTGSAEFSKKLVTIKSHGGLLPAHLKVRDGAIWHGEKMIETPEEKDVFELLGVPYIVPEKRS